MNVHTRIAAWLIATTIMVSACKQNLTADLNTSLPDKSTTAATALTGNYSEDIFTSLDFHNGYAGPLYTEKEGIIYLDNTVAIKKISLRNKVNPTANIKAELRLYQKGDGYDRDGQLFFIRDSVVKAILNNSTSFDAAAKQKLFNFAPKTGYLYVTPFFFWYQSIQSVPYTFNLKDVASLLTGEDSCWVGLSAWGVDWTGKKSEGHAYDWNLAGEKRTFTADLKITADNNSTNANPTYIQAVQFGTIKNTDGSNARTFSQTITIPHKLKNAKIIVISQAWGAGSGGEEYNYRTHNVSWDGSQIGTFSSKEACGPNTMRSFDLSSSPRNWCPSNIVTPHTINITGNIEAGSSHTVKLDIVNAKADDNNYFKISLYIAGEKI